MFEYFYDIYLFVLNDQSPKLSRSQQQADLSEVEVAKDGILESAKKSKQTGGQQPAEAELLSNQMVKCIDW